jgi:hypothetical protein
MVSATAFELLALAQLTGVMVALSINCNTALYDPTPCAVMVYKVPVTAFVLNLYQISSSGVPGVAAEQAVMLAVAVADKVFGEMLAVFTHEVPIVRDTAPAGLSLLGGGITSLTQIPNSPDPDEPVAASYTRI